MDYKNLKPPESKRLYLVTFEFSTGVQKTKFKKGFQAESEENLKEDIEKYLMECYGLKNSSEDERKFFYYLDDDLYVDLVDWREITSYEEFLFEFTKAV